MATEKLPLPYCLTLSDPLTLKPTHCEWGRTSSGLYKKLYDETKAWKIDTVSTEWKGIDLPMDVRETMNKVVKAKYEKIAVIDFATASVTYADGQTVEYQR
jgi:regulator of protease activity HflC (stomatin/prohibitin superfamily)